MSNEPYIDVVVKHRFTASPERVYDAFLDVEKAKHFMFATETGEMVRAEIDPRVGGKFVFTDRREDGDVEHTGEYLVLDRPHQIVFTFGIPAFSADFDRITLDIKPVESGTEVTLTHALHPDWKEYAERTTKGWAMILARLEEAISS